jgi:hypothetical protein
MPTVSPALSKEAMRSRAGLRWLLGLEALASRHGISEIEPGLKLGTRGTVYPCRKGSLKAMLKIGPTAELELEVEALRAWGAARLVPEIWGLEVPALEPLEPHLSILVSEHLEPGTPLPHLEPLQGRQLLAGLLNRLYERPFPFVLRKEREALGILKVRGLRAGVETGLASSGVTYELMNGVSLGQMLPIAQLADELVTTSDPSRWRLLHGDLHGHNLLLAGAQLRVIDPLPQWGEPEVDLARALVGPPLLHLTGALEEGSRFLAAASGADPERLFAWARVFGAMRVASESAQEPLDPWRRQSLLSLL